ncbi:hypothetical protein HYW54_02420 [Candidatus Gottesmanbacteria bacterium]|nr:hypothetical protein [Candidatus Gottesmanbacteria bacterium]
MPEAQIPRAEIAPRPTAEQALRPSSQELLQHSLAVIEAANPFLPKSPFVSYKPDPEAVRRDPNIPDKDAEIQRRNALGLAWEKLQKAIPSFDAMDREIGRLKARINPNLTPEQKAAQEAQIVNNVVANWTDKDGNPYLIVNGQRSNQLVTNYLGYRPLVYDELQRLASLPVTPQNQEIVAEARELLSSLHYDELEGTLKEGAAPERGSLPLVKRAKIILSRGIRQGKIRARDNQSPEDQGEDLLAKAKQIIAETSLTGRNNSGVNQTSEIIRLLNELGQEGKLLAQEINAARKISYTDEKDQKAVVLDQKGFQNYWMGRSDQLGKPEATARNDADNIFNNRADLSQDPHVQEDRKLPEHERLALGELIHDAQMIAQQKDMLESHDGDIAVRSADLLRVTGLEIGILETPLPLPLRNFYMRSCAYQIKRYIDFLSNRTHPPQDPRSIFASYDSLTSAYQGQDAMQLDQNRLMEAITKNLVSGKSLPENFQQFLTVENFAPTVSALFTASLEGETFKNDPRTALESSLPKSIKVGDKIQKIEGRDKTIEWLLNNKADLNSIVETFFGKWEENEKFKRMLSETFYKLYQFKERGILAKLKGGFGGGSGMLLMILLMKIDEVMNTGLVKQEQSYAPA